MIDLNLTGLLREINDLPDRSTSNVVDYLKLVFKCQPVDIKPMGRLTIIMHIDDIDLRLQREQSYNGLWYINWMSKFNFDVCLLDYVKHVRRSKRKLLEDKRFTYYGYSKRFVAFVLDKQTRLMDELREVTKRLEHSYQDDMRCLYKTEQRFRLAEQEVRGYVRDYRL